MATGAARASSASVKNRPAIKRTPIVSKNPGSTGRQSASGVVRLGGTAAVSIVTVPELLPPLSGRRFTAPTD